MSIISIEQFIELREAYPELAECYDPNTFTIRNEADYELALQEIDRCLDAASGSPERDRLEVLTVLVDDYELDWGTHA